MSRSSVIRVRWNQSGFHRWPDAREVTGERRAYLAERHRHLFYYEAVVEVSHDDRQIEFHDLLDECRAFTAQRVEHEHRSCEMLASEVLDFIESRFEVAGLVRSVTVLEDNECGATESRTG